MKLDLKNSKWWNTGFNNTYLQQQLTKFLEAKQEEQSMPQQLMPVEVRGALASPFVADTDQVMNLEGQLNDIRFRNEALSPEQPELRDIMAGLEQEAAGILESPMPFDMAADAPAFDPLPLEQLNAFAKLDQTDLAKQVFGSKTFDFANLEPEIENIDNQNIHMPKDERRRRNFEKQMLTADLDLNGKVKRIREHQRTEAFQNEG